ncbi:MAG: SPOR domain-containing protein [Candidatus Marinimicrobia bacterium]|nr:SPOR domain-containing protein [Candidatus Neomarinimicrobiota bacterium]
MSKCILWLSIFLSLLNAQNIDMYLSLIHEGQIVAVKEQVPELMSKYPNDPDVWYLKALITTNGDNALTQYQQLLEKFPESKFAHEAAMKVGEYYFARGLYSQSAKHFKIIPLKYHNSHNVQRAVDLLVNSFDATGESDSARYWISYIKSIHPNLAVDKYELDLNQKVQRAPKKLLKKEMVKKPYIIQIGAFGNLNNAERLRLQASQIGYNVEIHTVESNGKKLNAVRIVRYTSKRQAKKAGEEIKRKLGMDYRVLYRP